MSLDSGPLSFKASLQPLFTYCLNETEIAQCERFANQVIETNSDWYTKLGGNSHKFFDNIYKSKVTEVAVSNVLNSIKLDGYCSRPDFTVYPAHKKSYDADLKVYTNKPSTLSLHVKSFPITNTEGFRSWAINPLDPHFKTPTSKDFVALTISDVEHHAVYIIDILPIKQIPANVYAAPNCRIVMKCIHYAAYTTSLKHLSVWA